MTDSSFSKRKILFKENNMADTIRVWLGANWLPLLIAVYLIGMMLYGHDRGFLKLAVSMFALVLTIYLVRLVLPHVTSYIRTNTGIEQGIKSVLLKQAGLENISEEQTQSEIAQKQAIDSLNIPQNLKSILEKNNTKEFWNILGVDKFKEYVSGCLSSLMVNYIGFAVLFVIIWILLHLVIRFADIFTRLPVIHGLNQIAGAVLGLAEALIYLWTAFLLLSACSGTYAGGKLLALITGSRWITYLFNNNLLLFFLKDLLNTML